jgi:transposase InsO family protein
MRFGPIKSEAQQTALSLHRTRHLLVRRRTQLVNRIRATGLAARIFLDHLIAAVPYQIHTVLTDNAIQFADRPKNRAGPTARWRGHPFDRACQQHGVEHRLTKPNHPWTNGQVERMNRTLKEATVRRYHDETHQQLEDHLAAFLDADNFATRLKTLRGLTPYQAICKAWAETPDRFRLDPVHLTLGLNT